MHMCTCMQDQLQSNMQYEPKEQTVNLSWCPCGFSPFPKKKKQKINQVGQNMKLLTIDT